MGLDSQRIEDCRAASLLHDIGKLDISRDFCTKRRNLPRRTDEMRKHVAKGGEILQPVGGRSAGFFPSSWRITTNSMVPVITDSRGRNPSRVAHHYVADVYDAMTSDRPYRKAITTFEARNYSQGAGKNSTLVLSRFLYRVRHRPDGSSRMVV